MPKRKKPDKNKRCQVCATKFAPNLDACPKCGYKSLQMPNFAGQRKPLASGGKLKLKK